MVAEIEITSPDFLSDPPDSLDPPDLFSSVIDAYQEHSYEAGYARGINDAQLALLEAADEFSRQRSEAPNRTRQLLHAFSKFLEQKLDSHSRHTMQEFIDGSGI
jgi:hypothetical protein